jgi:hypothetical protein
VQLEEGVLVRGALVRAVLVRAVLLKKEDMQWVARKLARKRRRVARKRNRKRSKLITLFPKIVIKQSPYTIM